MAEAAVGAVLNIVSGVFGAIGLAAFATSFVPKPPTAITQVTIAVGQGNTTTDVDSLSGDHPAISVFAIDGRLIGSDGGNAKKTWPTGSINSVPIKNNNCCQNVQAEYVAIYAIGTDAICISAVGLKNPNSDDSYGWFADVGVNCGMQHHWSETTVGSTENTANYRPDCVWISATGSNNGIVTAGFSFHIIDFSMVTPALASEYNKSYSLACDAPPRFSAWTSIDAAVAPPIFNPFLVYNTDGSDADPTAVLDSANWEDLNDYGHLQNANGLGQLAVPPVRMSSPDPPSRKRSNSPVVKRASIFNATLISSPYPEHSAQQLCDSPNSYGPDVVSETEGLFCDMETKQVWPVCTQASQTGCFDTEAYTLRGSSAKRAEVPEKKYTQINKWGRS
jgi:hypothetical protein